MKVFLTDAHYKHTLAATRSLGEKNIYVVAGSSSRPAQSFYSKYCREQVVYPDPRDEEPFINFMLRYVKEHETDVLLPIGWVATTVLSKYKKEFLQYTKLPVADWDLMKIACNKNMTYELAGKLGIKMPKIYENAEEIERFPVVVKGNQESGHIRYVNSSIELSEINISDSTLQEYIPGEGYGVFSLFNAGQARAVFMHKRIREYPITGGPSTAAESVYDSELKDLGLKLLKSLNWHGVAMVEFKKDNRDKEFKLMEINPKFWGSLDLAIASGVDFPYLTVKMAVEGDVEFDSRYNIGIEFRWPFPDDVLHVLSKPSSIGAFIGDFFRKNVRSNILLDDLKPNLFQLYITFRGIVSYALKRRKAKYPHGIPRVNP
jgi:predicted ATP-grasp superfamily ATP-dependent carboligase